MKPKLAQSFRDAAPYNPMIRNVVVAFDIIMAKAEEGRGKEREGVVGVDVVVWGVIGGDIWGSDVNGKY